MNDDFVVALFGFSCLLFIPVILLAVLIHWVGKAVKRSEEAKAAAEKISRQIASIERRLGGLEASLAGKERPAEVLAPPPATAPAPPPVAMPVAPIVPEGPRVPPPAMAPPAPPRLEVPVTPRAPVELSPPPAPAAPEVLPGPPVVSPLPRKPVPPPVRPAPVAPPPKPVPIEALVRKWAARIGITLLVVGVSYGVSLYLRQAGPLTKDIATGIGALLLLGAGAWFEKREPYRILGRALMCGGWGLLYFIVFAAHAIPALRVIESPVLASVWLLVVATGMIAHSLRYRTAWVTGAAIFLALLTVALSESVGFALVASAILAALAVVLARVYRWGTVALLGVIATWGNHGYTVYGKMAGPDGAIPPEKYGWTVGFAVLYVVLFVLLDLVSKHGSEEDERLGALVLVLNFVGFLGVAVPVTYLLYPGSMDVLLGASALGALLAAAGERLLRRVTAHRICGLAALVLGMAASHYHFAGVRASVAWLVLAQGFALYGFLGREPFFRVLGVSAFVLPLFRLIAASGTEGTETIRVLARWQVQFHVLIGAAAGVLLFGNAGVYRRVDQANPIPEGERAFARLTALVGGVLLLGYAAWATDPRYWGVAWLLLSVVWWESGLAARAPDLRIFSFVAGFLSLLATVATVLPGEGFAVLGIRGRPLLAGCAILWAFVLDLRARGATGGGRAGKAEAEAGAVLSVLACPILMALLALELRPAAVAVGFLIAAWVLAEAGLRIPVRHFCGEGAGLAFASGIALVVCDSIAVGDGAGKPERYLYGLLAILLFLGLTQRLRFAERHGERGEFEWGVPVFLSWEGALLVAFAEYRVMPEWAVPVGLAVTAIVFRELPRPLRWAPRRHQAFALSLLASVWALGVLLLDDGTWGAVTHRIAGGIPVALALYVLFWRSEAEGAQGTLERGEPRLGAIYSWAAAVVLAVLLPFELPQGKVLLGWSVLFLVWLLAGAILRIAALRFQGYLLAALTFLWGIGIAPGLDRRVAWLGFSVCALFAGQAMVHLVLRRDHAEPIPDWRKRERLAAGYFAVLGAVLLAILLYHQVQGGWLTVAWAAEAAALILAGVLLRLRVERLLGIALIAICIVKLFVLDLRGVETFYRVVSMIVVGLVLLAVAWLYARFRERLKEYL